MGYTARGAVMLSATSVSAAKTLIQLIAPSTGAVELIRASVTFSTTTSTAQRVQLLRQTTAGTVTGGTIVSLNGATPGSTAGVNATVEPTAGNVLYEEYVNMLNGFLLLPVPEERIVIPASGRLGLKLPDAPSAVTLTAVLVFGELN